MTQSYRTVAQPAQLELVVDRSRFLGYCQEVATEAEVKAFLTEIRRQHPRATHHCYAWRIGSGEHPMEYYSDQGEPSGTAGKPILGAIQRLQLTNTGLVVVRYFGGKKLGVRGLIEAYAQTATQVLEKAGPIQKTPVFQVELVCDYAHHQTWLHRLHQLRVAVASDFGATVTLHLTVPENQRPGFEELLKELAFIELHPR